jgi:hypothetical protein
VKDELEEVLQEVLQIEVIILHEEEKIQDEEKIQEKNVN